MSVLTDQQLGEILDQSDGMPIEAAKRTEQATIDAVVIKAKNEIIDKMKDINKTDADILACEFLMNFANKLKDK